jgi:hypothetical protein
MRNYDIPTKKDVEMLVERLERIENLIRSTSGMRVKKSGSRISKENTSGRNKTATASDQVFDVIKRFKLGVGFADIQSRTGFDDKKVRNIIFRLNKLGKIKRKSRGIYIAT